MLTIGLTGGIGSGKSTVATILVSLQIPVIDADAISRSVTQPGGLAIVLIREAFGDTFIAQDGGLNRDAMRERILQAPDAKARLESIIHPLVGEQINLQLRHAAQTGAAFAVVDIPLLIEGAARWRSRLDCIWVIDCLPSTQIERVISRSGWPLSQIEAVLAVQASREQRLACADVVIFNDGINLEQLRMLVLDLLQQQMLRTAA